VAPTSRRSFLRTSLGGLAAGALVGCGVGPKPPPTNQFTFVVQPGKCIGCTRCVDACSAENDVGEGNLRTWIERDYVDQDGQARKDTHATVAPFQFEQTPRDAAPGHPAGFLPNLCQQCADAPCVTVCPVGASFISPEGLTLVDDRRCIGCGYCVQACPYGVRYLHPKTGIADKCTWCYHRITRGGQPACVEACPTGARDFGDLADPQSPLHDLLAERVLGSLRPEFGTRPRVVYLSPEKR
jgi:tetrathionate reductase subunit B